MVASPEVIFLDCGGEWPIAVLPYGRENTAPPVIMLHGLESHSAWFARSAAHIASLGYPVYGMDRRGSGHSVAPRGWCGDFQDLLDDIDALADTILPRHGKDRFHLLGHCFGAIPATAYACSRPGRLHSLVLGTPAIYTLAGPPFGDKLKILWAGLTGSRMNIPVPLEAEWFTDNPEHLDFIRSDPLALHEASARIYWETARARRFIHAHEDALTMPVFMGLAERDRICDNTEDRAFFDRIPTSRKRCVTYDGAIHILEFSERKQDFFSDLDEWFAEIDPVREELV